MHSWGKMIIWEEPDFCNLPKGVTDLFAEAGEGSFFAQATWYDLMARHAQEPGARVRLYLDSERALGALVCRTEGARRLHSFSNAYSVEHGPVMRIRDKRALDALTGLVAEVARERPDWEAISFAALDPTDPSYSALLDGLRAAGFVIRVSLDFGTWFEDTRGLDFRHYLDERPSVLKNTFRRKSKVAQAQDLEYVFAEPEADLERMILDYETVYRNSWKKMERFPTFMPELVRMAGALGALRMGVIRHRGVPAAAQFWILWHERAIIYKLAYDERYRSLSLGTLLTMRMIERVLELDKPSEINFGRGDDPYKQMWLTKRREHWGFLAANPRTVRGLRLSARALAGRWRDRLLQGSHHRRRS